MVKKRKKYQLNVFPSYKGGHTTLYGQYIFEFCPGHHLQNMWGFVAQHRLVAEDKIGRPLKQGEHVHHVDEVKTNNHPDNIGVMSMAEHRRHHMNKIHENSRIPLDKEDVLAALEGRSLKNAAKLLKIDVQTIRNRFPEIWETRKRKTPAVLSGEVVEQILKYSSDPNTSIKEAALILGVSEGAISRYCRKHRKPWLKVKRSKVDEFRSHYRGKPTLRALIMNGSIPELVGKEDQYRNKRLPKRLYQTLYQKYVQQV